MGAAQSECCVGTMTPASSNLSSSCSTFWRRAYSTDQGLYKCGGCIFDVELSLDSLDSAQLRLEHRVVSLQDILRALLGLHVEDVYHSSFNLASHSRPNRLGPSPASHQSDGVAG